MRSSHSKSWSNFTGTALGTLKTIQGASEAIPIPYIPSAFKVLVGLLETIHLTNENKEDLIQLAADATQLVLEITTEYQRPGNDKDWAGKDLEEAGNNVLKTLLEIAELVKKRAERRWLGRSLTTIVDKSEILRHRTKLNLAATKFQITLHIGQRRDLQELKTTAENIVDKLQEVKKEVHQAFDEQRALGALEKWVSPDAKHYSSARFPPPRCDEGSRKLVTKRIMRWCRAHVDGIGDDDEELDDDQVQIETYRFWLDGPYDNGNLDDDALDEMDILWLHASYGSGKSAIMQSLSDTLDQLKDTLERPILGGTFFFGRDIPSRNQAIFLIPTIAEQIGQKYPEFRKNLLRAIDQDPTILEKVDTHAFNLLVSPLSKCTTLLSDTQPLIILIDGLDECEKLAEKSTCSGVDAQCYVLKAIRVLSESKLHLRIVVASRPEKHIEVEFRDNLKAISTHISLHKRTWWSEGCKNVSQKIRDGFEKIRKDTPRLGEHWPGKWDLNRIIHAAGDQYLYASTVLDFVGADDFLPDEQLAIVLNDNNHGHAEAFEPMDKLIHQILGSCPKQQQDAMMMILAGLIYSYRQPKSASWLAALAGVQVDLAKKILRRLTGIVRTEVQYDEELESKWSWLVTERLRYKIHHISTEDFLETKERSGDFYIDCDWVYVPKMQSNACALLSQMMLGKCTQVHQDMLEACERILVFPNENPLLLETLQPLMEGGKLWQDLPLGPTQRKALWVLERVMDEIGLDPTAGACEKLLQTSMLNTLSDRVTAKPFQTLLEVCLYGWQSALFEKLVTPCPSVYEAITLFSDMFFIDHSSNWCLYLYRNVESIFYEIAESSLIEPNFYSHLLMASITIISSLYADEFPEMEKTWVSQLDSGSMDFDWDLLHTAIKPWGKVRPTQELQELLKRFVEILDIARTRPSSPPKNLAQLFQRKLGRRDIQRWVRELKEARDETETSTPGIKDDSLFGAIGQLIEELDDSVKELELRGLNEGWISKPEPEPEPEPFDWPVAGELPQPRAVNTERTTREE